MQLGRPKEGERALRGLLAEPRSAGPGLTPARTPRHRGALGSTTTPGPSGRRRTRSRVLGQRGTSPGSRSCSSSRGSPRPGAGASRPPTPPSRRPFRWPRSWGRSSSGRTRSTPSRVSRRGSASHDRCHEHADLAIARCAALGLDWFAGSLAQPRAQRSRARTLRAGGRARRGGARAAPGRGVRDPDEFTYETLVEALVRLGRDELPARAVAEMEEARRCGRATRRRCPHGPVSGARRGGRPRPCALRAGDRDPSRLLAVRARPHASPLRRAAPPDGRAASRARQLRAAPSSSSGSVPTGGPSGAAGSSLRAVPGSGSVDAATRDELTPQELQVALQVARGREPRDRADALPQPEDGGVPSDAHLPQARAERPRRARRAVRRPGRLRGPVEVGRAGRGRRPPPGLASNPRPPASPRRAGDACSPHGGATTSP